MHTAFIVQRICQRRKLGFLVVAGFLLLGCIGVAVDLSSSGAGSVGPPSASIGDQMDRSLSPTLSDATFTDQAGRHVTLGEFAGPAVFLVPFLTSCQEECPVTAGALLAIERTLVANRLEHKVAIVEVTVDPGRDVPERLAAYAKLTGAGWPLLTATPATIAALVALLWHLLPGRPRGLTARHRLADGQPSTYDVDHSDGFILLDSHLHERFVAAGMVRESSLSPALRHLLDSQGVSDLAHPGGGSWTIAEALEAIGWVQGQPVSDQARP